MGLGLAAIQNTLELWQQGYFEEINSVAEMGSQELHVTGEDFRNLIQQACLPDNEKYDFPASCLGNVYNIGSGATTSVNKIVELLGGEKVYIPKRPGEPDCTFADTTRIRRELNWQAKVPIEEGIKVLLEQIDYWQDAPVWTPEKIHDATQDWFRYLADDSV